MGKAKTVPQLRFPEFNEEWETSRANDLFNITAGGDISPEHVSSVKTSTFKYPIYANALKNNGLYGYSDIYKIEPNAITVAGRGVYIGISHVRHHRFYPIVRLLVLIQKGELNTTFFQYCINNYRTIIESTGVPQLTAPQFSLYKFKHPTLNEQRKIAGFLTAVDAKIQQLQKKKELLELYRKGVMQRIFNQEIRFKDDEGNEYPDWEESNFEELYSFKRTNSISRAYLTYLNGTVKNIHYGDIHTKFSTLYDVNKEHTPFIESILIKDKKIDEDFCREGDLVIADASEDYIGVGKCIELVNLNNEKVVAGLHTILARPDLDRISIGFFGYLMQSNSLRKQIVRIAQGSKVLSISMPRLGKLCLDLPCTSEQTKIASFLSAIDDKITLVNRQLDSSKVFKKGLLQQMFV